MKSRSIISALFCLSVLYAHFGFAYAENLPPVHVGGYVEGEVIIKLRENSGAKIAGEQSGRLSGVKELTRIIKEKNLNLKSLRLTRSELLSFI